ncbi:hypothetical protein ACVR0C_04360 [Streptococcus downii]|uniref:Uncharacterized protein n=1 Tax=Streptococcus downii TaxID=1968889 RepID=A0ABW0Y3W4_9STRE|nr:hypothetical protein [Streptococcus downii]
MKRFFPCHFKDICKKNNYNWNSIFINLFFSFVLTILFVTLPLTENDSLDQFWDKFYQKLATGALLSSIISINGIYMITLYSRIKSKYNISDFADNTSKELKIMLIIELIKYEAIPTLCIIPASGLLFISQNNKLHPLMVILQLLIYVISLFFIGYIENYFTPEDLESEQQSYLKKQEINTQEVVRSVSDSDNAEMIKKARKNKLKE